MEAERIGSMTEEEEESNHNDDDDAETRGWPLGLLPDMTLKMAEASAASSMMLPSCTSSSGSSSSSSSSSDFETESVGSFFPENSTSLGTLIGIHSSSEFSFRQDLSLEERSPEKRLGRHRRLFSLLGCGAKIAEDPMEGEEFEDWMGSSRFDSRNWSMDRGRTTQSAPPSMRIDIAGQQRVIEDTVGVYEEQHSSEAFQKSWVRSVSCRPSQRTATRKPGPVSSWKAFWDSPHCLSDRRNEGSMSGSTRNRLHGFWLAFCSKISSNLAIWSF